MAKSIEPGRNGQATPKPPKPETAADVLRRCLGLGNVQAAEMAETLGDEERKELVELAKLPHHGPAVRRLLDQVADRKSRESRVESRESKATGD